MNLKSIGIFETKSHRRTEERSDSCTVKQGKIVEGLFLRVISESHISAYRLKYINSGMNEEVAFANAFIKRGVEILKTLFSQT